MRIDYNRDACQGHNNCVLVAPELFDLDDEGYAVPLLDGELPSELEEKAQNAAARCPEFAIEVTA